MTETKKPIFPMIDLGPPCEAEGCSGVLINTICHKTMDHYKVCSVCEGEFSRMTEQEVRALCDRVFTRAFGGETEH